MPLFIINKQTQAVERPLTSEEEIGIIDFFIKKKDRSKTTERLINVLCGDLYQRDLWVQCRCIAHNNEHPVVRFNVSKSTRYYVRRIHSRGAHAESCPFFRDFEESDANRIKTIPNAIEKKSGALNVMKKRGKGIANATGTAQKIRIKDNNSQTRSTLCNVLYRLLDDAGCNRISQESTTKPYQALNEAIRNTELIINKPLSPYFYQDAKKLVSAAVALRNDNSVWPKDVPKHCLFFLNVTHFENKTLTVKLLDGTSKDITLSNAIKTSSGRLGKRSGPYMALINVTDTSEKPGFFNPFDAFVVPRYSDKTFIPVDSHFEREMLRHLYSLQHQLQAKNIQLTIHKPLFDIPVQVDGEDVYPVLPDFMLTTATQTLIIEVDGSHEESYKARKKRTQLHMETLGKVFVFDAITHDANGHLEQELAAFKNQLRAVLC